MSRSQRPKKVKATSIGKVVTLHSFFGLTSQSTAIPTSPKPTEIIDIGSDDENIKSPVSSKRKTPGNLDPDSISSCSKRGRVSRSTAKSTTESYSSLKYVPLSSLNRTAAAVEAEPCIKTSRTQKMTNLVGDWEMGDDEFLGTVDNSQVVGDEGDSSEITLNTCPVCGAIFVDFCLSVSAAVPSPLLIAHIHAPSSSNYEHMWTLALITFQRDSYLRVLRSLAFAGPRFSIRL